MSETAALAFTFLAFGCAFSVMVIIAGIVGLITGISPFGGFPAPPPPFQMPEINPNFPDPSPRKTP